jgi:bacterioferritin-associated ferredoxin
MVVLNDRLVCRCLQVTESDLLEALDRCPLQSLQDVAVETGAGSGCTACHRLLRKYLAAGAQCPSPCPPICSVR